MTVGEGRVRIDLMDGWMLDVKVERRGYECECGCGWGYRTNQAGGLFRDIKKKKTNRVVGGKMGKWVDARRKHKNNNPRLSEQ